MPILEYIKNSPTQKSALDSFNKNPSTTHDWNLLMYALLRPDSNTRSAHLQFEHKWDFFTACEVFEYFTNHNETSQPYTGTAREPSPSDYPPNCKVLTVVEQDREIEVYPSILEKNIYIHVQNSYCRTLSLWHTIEPDDTTQSKGSRYALRESK